MMAKAGSTGSGGARKFAVWMPLLLALLAAPALEGCSKRRVARATPVTVPAASVPSSVLTETTVISSAGVATDGDLSAHAADAEAEDESSALAAITPGAVGPGDHPGAQGASGLSGDDLPGRLAAVVGAGSAQSVLEQIAKAGDMRVFFSTNSIDRGLTSRRVQPAGSSRAAAIDEVCRQAGLSCFYAADFKSLSVYDPREFVSAGPDMTALVYNRKQGYSAAPARNAGAAAPSRPISTSAPARSAAPAKPRKPAAAAAAPSPSRKPGTKAKPAATASRAKPAVKPTAKPKPTEASADMPTPGVKPRV